MNERRPLWIVTGLLLGAAALLWISSMMTWAPGVTGASALVPLALLALAGIAGVLATSGWARRVVGVLLALAGPAAAWMGLESAFGQVEIGFTGLLARLLAVLAGVAFLGAGALLVSAGHRMPKLGGNYQTPSAAKDNESAEKQLWRALSEGDDPTMK